MTKNKEVKIGGFSGKLYLRPHEVRPAIQRYTSILKEHGHEPERIKELAVIFYTNNIIVKYTDEQEDRMLQYWFDMINSGPEGFKQAMEYALSNTPTFEHRMSKCSQSYEKGNIALKVRKAEHPWEFKKPKKNKKANKSNQAQKTNKPLKETEVIN